MKIALIGSAPSSVYLAPYDNPEWTVWACSPGAYGVAKNVKAWFEMHRYEPGQPWFSEGYCKFLENAEFPVYMSEPTPRVKNCALVPYEDLVKKYGPYYFNSSLSWMMAMAIEAGATTIGLWGVDMSHATEYSSQKMGLIHFALLAKSMGIEVGVPPESDLFVPPPLYGVCEVNQSWIKATMRKAELEQRKADAEHRFAHAKEELTFLNGALDDNKYHQQTWLGNIAAKGKEFTEPKAGTIESPQMQVMPDGEIKPIMMTCVDDLNPPLIKDNPDPIVNHNYNVLTPKISEGCDPTTDTINGVPVSDVALKRKKGNGKCLSK